MSDWGKTATGLYAPAYALRKRRRPTAIDLFCGCGGFSLGFMQAGFEVLAGLDYEVECMVTYMANLGSYPAQIHYVTPEDMQRAEKYFDRTHIKGKKGIITIPTSGSAWISHHPEVPPVRHFWLGDVRKVTGKQMLDALGMKQGEVDCVFGGPPCQGFSFSGKREVMDPRNSLVMEFARMVLEIQPKTMVMENVPGMLSMTTVDGVPVVDALCRVLEDGGFGDAEALKKSLVMSSGSGMALKSFGKGKPEPEDDDDETQLSLLQEASSC